MDADYYIAQYIGGGTTTTTYHRRPHSALWSYIKSKTDTLYPTKAGSGASGTWGINISGTAKKLSAVSFNTSGSSSTGYWLVRTITTESSASTHWNGGAGMYSVLSTNSQSNVGVFMFKFRESGTYDTGTYVVHWLSYAGSVSGSVPTLYITREITTTQQIVRIYMSNIGSYVEPKLAVIQEDSINSGTLTTPDSYTLTTTMLGDSMSNSNSVYATVAKSATVLATARTFRTNLASTSTASFNGSANVTPGVTGTLPLANGGTGATTAAAALKNLGITVSASDLNTIKTHTHSYAGSDSAGGAANTVKVTTENPSSAATRYLLWAEGYNGNKVVKGNDGLRYYTLEGTSSAAGIAQLGLGNATASGTAGNKAGKIYMYGTSTGYTTLAPANNSTTNYNVYLPAANGTLALNNAASTTAAGLMSASDKSKLDGITASADSVSYSASATSGNKVGTLTINGSNYALYSPTQTTVSGNAGTASRLANTYFTSTGSTSSGYFHLFTNTLSKGYAVWKGNYSILDSEQNATLGIFSISVRNGSSATTLGYCQVSWDCYNGKTPPTLYLTYVVNSSSITYHLYLGIQGTYRTYVIAPIQELNTTAPTKVDSIVTSLTGTTGSTASHVYATSLQTARTIQTNLGSTSSASFNGTANITPGITGTLSVAHGGTGATTLTSGAALIGNGTGAVATRAILNNTSAGASGWTSSTGTSLITSNTLAYWNGAYTGTSSNLTYCSKGAFGSIVTKNTSNFAAISASTVGSTTQPVFVNNGTVTATTYALNKTVPSDAVFTDTHYTTKIYAGASGTNSNAATSNPYIKVIDNTTYRNQIRLVGSGGTSIASDASGNVTVSSTSIKTITVTLAAASWSSLKQTVTATGVTASNTVIISPAPASHTAYGEAGVYCSAQASNSLTFTCTETPTSELTVNAVILN